MYLTPFIIFSLYNQIKPKNMNNYLNDHSNIKFSFKNTIDNPQLTFLSFFNTCPFWLIFTFILIRKLHNLVVNLSNSINNHRSPNLNLHIKIINTNQFQPIFVKKHKYNLQYKFIVILWLSLTVFHPNYINRQHIYNDIYNNGTISYCKNSNFKTYRIEIYCTIKLLKQIENEHKKTMQNKSNKTNHTINGNLNKNTKLNLLQLNKGNANFENKINEINHTMAEHLPDIMCISEANLKYSNKNIINNFPDHNIELNKMAKNIDVSRNILIINNKISYKRRYDLEDEITSTIWIQVNIPRKKSILVMGGYRQWQLPKSFDKTNTKTAKKQLERWNLILDKWQLALKEKRDTIVLMDDNIDTSLNNNHNKNYNIKQLFDNYQKHINENNLTLHNSDFTRIVSHQPPSCIDHITSNCCNKIINVKTHNNIFSDHKIITAQYNAVLKIYHPKFIKSRNFRLLTTEAISLYINNSYLLNSIFRYDNPEIITNIIQIELNAIIDSIAPAKIVQYKKDFCPYYDSNIVNKLKLSNVMLTAAINSHNQNDWRAFKNDRNDLSKIIDKAKSTYCKNNFKNKNKQWKFIKNFNNSNKQQIPNNITHNNKQITSPRELANIANNYFIDKIIKIRNAFTPSTTDPIEILSKLIPRNNNSLVIPEITLKQTIDLINKLKSSNSTGHDSINNKII